MNSPPSQNLETAPLINVSCFFPTFSYLRVCHTYKGVLLYVPLSCLHAFFT